MIFTLLRLLPALVAGIVAGVLYPRISAWPLLDNAVLTAAIGALLLNAVGGVLQNELKGRVDCLEGHIRSLSRRRRERYRLRAVRARENTVILISINVAAGVLAGVVSSSLDAMSLMVRCTMAVPLLVLGFISIIDARSGLRYTQQSKDGIDALLAVEAEHRAAKAWLLTEEGRSREVDSPVSGSAVGVVRATGTVD
ncbi:MAG: hypothetical protein IT353_18930 [Gemmatimonadaceae bacterium]|nr:hypothetical protein [Gemmatimonadaceae bacterium]